MEGLARDLTKQGCDRFTTKIDRTNMQKDKFRLLQQQRQRLYPTLYSDQNTTDVKQILDHYAVDYFLVDEDDCFQNYEYENPLVDQPLLKKPKRSTTTTSVVPDTNDPAGNDQCQSENQITATVGIFHIDRFSVNDKNSNISSDDINNAPNIACDVVVPEQPVVSQQQHHDIDTPQISSSGDTIMYIQPTDSIIATSEEVPSSLNAAIVLPPPPPPAAAAAESSTLSQQQPSVTTSSSSMRDIWGRIPPKEYIATNQMNNNNNHTSMTTTLNNNNNNSDGSSCMMICSICHQKVGSSLRYASHLDKCLGIGTMSRNNNSSSHNSNS